MKLYFVDRDEDYLSIWSVYVGGPHNNSYVPDYAIFSTDPDRDARVPGRELYNIAHPNELYDDRHLITMVFENWGGFNFASILSTGEFF